MRVLFSDGQLLRWGGRVHLLHLNAGWCVVGPGYACSVNSADEGLKVMAELKADGERRGIVIKQQLGVC